MQECGKHRGIKLLSHVMKLLERILDGMVRKTAENKLGEEHPEFTKVSRSTFGMFAVSQLAEKRLERQVNVALGCARLSACSELDGHGKGEMAESRIQDSGNNTREITGKSICLA